MAFIHSPKIITDGLVLCLDAANHKSYPGSGTSWFDLSGNNNSGSLVNGTSYSTNNNGIMSFDGSNDHVLIGRSNTNNITGNQITFGAWVFPTVSNKYQLILVKSLGATRQYGMFLSGNGTSQIYRTLTGVVGEGDVALSTNWGVNAWNYILLVYNGSTIKIYLNANEVFSQNATGNITTTNTDVYIGGDPAEPYFLSGNIANAVIYNRALSAQEISQNFNTQRSRFGL
jgi:hypothetical protein